MEIICTQDAGQLRPLYPEMSATYQAAFADDWGEVGKCPLPTLTNRERCVGGFTSRAVGELCVDCQCRVTDPAYTDEECAEMFDALLAQGAAYYLERNESGVLVTTIGVPETVGELAKVKYGDVPAMQAWLADNFNDNTETTYLTESFANRTLRPSGNMWNRGQCVRQIVAQTGPKLVTTRTKSPAIVAATLRAFPNARLYVPDADNQSAWNAELTQFGDRASGSVPDRRAFIVWEVE